MNERAVGFSVSFFLHALFFLCGGAVLATPAQYAVEAGAGGIEVNLMAAFQEPAAPPEAVIFREPDRAAKETVKEEPAPLPLQQHAMEEKPLTGPLYATGSGALTASTPDYLKNPAPFYPLEARKNGWEGLVVLRVDVDPSGWASGVEIEDGSGHDILDQSALKTVRKWRFRPARLGALPVESSVRIPIRFKIDGS